MSDSGCEQADQLLCRLCLQLMSYGSMTGEAYVSDITLAFLEDTNQYIANYTNAGRFVESQESEVKMSSFSFLQGEPEYETPAAPRSNGYIRWGRDAGCDFVNARPVAWEDRCVTILVRSPIFRLFLPPPRALALTYNS